MKKLTAYERNKLWRVIGILIARGFMEPRHKNGMQQRVADEFGVSRAYVHQITQRLRGQ